MLTLLSYLPSGLMLLAALAWLTRPRHGDCESAAAEHLMAGIVCNAAALVLWNALEHPAAMLGAWVAHALPMGLSVAVWEYAVRMREEQRFAWPSAGTLMYVTVAIGVSLLRHVLA